RVEVLLQPVFGGLAGVDGAANLRHRSQPLTPKNRGPDQRAPVISRAIADSERKRLPRQKKPSSSTSTSCLRPFHSRTNRAPVFGLAVGLVAPLRAAAQSTRR